MWFVHRRCKIADTLVHGIADSCQIPHEIICHGVHVRGNNGTSLTQPMFASCFVLDHSLASSTCQSSKSTSVVSQCSPHSSFLSTFRVAFLMGFVPFWRDFNTQTEQQNSKQISHRSEAIASQQFLLFMYFTQFERFCQQFLCFN